MNTCKHYLDDRSRLLGSPSSPERDAALKRISQELRALGQQSSAG